MTKARKRVERLELSAGGVWVVRSSSPTQYFLDLTGAHPSLLRLPGPGSPTGPFDGCYLRLVRVRSVGQDVPEESGVVVVGRRHLYDLDPDPGGRGDAIWWLARAVASIEEVSDGEQPIGGPVAKEGYTTPFEPAGSGSAP